MTVMMMMMGVVTGDDSDGDDGNGNDGGSRDGSPYVARVLGFPGSQQCPSEAQVSQGVKKPFRIIFIYK